MAIRCNPVQVACRPSVTAAFDVRRTARRICGSEASRASTANRRGWAAEPLTAPSARLTCSLPKVWTRNTLRRVIWR
jgi:hypothetical protein